MLRIIASLLFVAFLSGCQSTKMNVATVQTLNKVAEDKSRVVFMRSSFLGNAIQSSVYEVTSGEPEFIGIVSNETRVAYVTSPGEKVFMVVGESADFLKASLDSGKTYYSVVTPRMGVWKARFSLHPVRNEGQDKTFLYSSDKIKKMITGTKLVEAGEEALVWATNNAGDIKKKYEKNWAKWQKKSAKEQQEATIRAEDHIH
ncbi:hypothetical protein L1286_20260 [Pseudoalteromonas sp. SMS1]|uniref:hypothetical protein n=1 Tax=Pseudoalteromonas sp. SMS1 TaxID=2908894 RepID=UPI001F2C40B0|nr:hypothetical protein [Pseudoalteromonas sp. SMS1]MCF2859820.1 hypothetical protein [Pseudoalteromonas sp. SMS1]